MSAPAEEIGTGTVRSEWADAESLLRLGLGKGEPTDATVTKMLDATFAVAGPAAMQDILSFCQRWREGLVQQSRQEVKRKTGDLRTECNDRLPDSEQKSAIVTLHVAAYWALRDDTDDFVRSIVHRRRLADFWDAFEELLRPNIKPLCGWKKKWAEVVNRRMAEAYPTLEPQRDEYRRALRSFERQLRYGERWSRLRREFGAGILALLPRAVISNRWVEQTLKTAQFDAWLNVLRRHNCPGSLIVVRAGELIERALTGEEPPTQLRQESSSFADIARDCRDPALLLPSSGPRDGEEDAYGSDGAFDDPDIMCGLG